MKNFQSYLCGALLIAQAAAQGTETKNPALERARLTFELEHDVPGALQMYLAVAQDAQAVADVRRAAWLEAGKLQRRLGHEAEAREAFAQAANGNDAIAKEAAFALDQKAPDVERLASLRAQVDAAITVLRESRPGPNQPQPGSSLGGRKSATHAQYNREFGCLIGQWSPACDDLVWMGVEAVPGLRREFESLVPDPLEGDAVWMPDYRNQLCAVLWSIGEPEAIEVLRTWYASGDPAQKTAVRLGILDAGPLKEPAAGLVETLLADPGEQGTLAVQTMRTLKYNSPRRPAPMVEWSGERFLRLLELPNPLLQWEILDGILARDSLARTGSGTRPWIQDRLNAAQQAQLASQLGGFMASPEPALNQIAWEVVQNLGLLNADFRRLYLDMLGTEKWDRGLLAQGPSRSVGRPQTTFPAYPKGPLDLLPLLGDPITEAERVAYLKALERFRTMGGPAADSARRLGQSLDAASFCWDGSAAPLVFESYEAGVIDEQGLWMWIGTRLEPRVTAWSVDWVIAHPAQAWLFQSLVAVDLPVELLPKLRTLIDRILAAGEEGQNREYLLHVARLARGTGAEQAIDFLATEVPRVSYGLAAAWLLHWSQTRDDESLRAGMRKLLVLDSVQPGAQPARSRGDILLRLLEWGDAETLQTVEQWGFRELEGNPAFNLSRQLTDGTPMNGIDWIFGAYEGQRVPGMPERKPKRAFSGSPELLKTTLERLLAGIPVEDLLERENTDPEGSVSEARAASLHTLAHVPAILEWEEFMISGTPLAEIVAEWLLAHIQAGTFEAGGTEPSKTLLRSLERLFRIRQRWSSEAGEPPASGTLQKLFQVCMQGQTPALARFACYGIRLDEGAQYAEDLYRWLGTQGASNAALAGIENLKLTTRREHWQELAQSCDQVCIRATRPEVFSLIAPDAKPDWILPLLACQDSEVRTQVCIQLGRMLDAQAVPALLERLGDPELTVRSAATEALTQIRFFHEEQARWQRFFAGTMVDGQSAAEALLRQAGETEPVADRVLALRSLGKLGEAEALPFLIQWSKSEEPAIASAARAAIEAILQNQ